MISNIYASTLNIVYFRIIWSRDGLSFYLFLFLPLNLEQRCVRLSRHLLTKMASCSGDHQGGVEIICSCSSENVVVGPKNFPTSEILQI